MPSPEPGGGHAAAGISQSCRWCGGGVAARRGRATVGNAGGRIPRHQVGSDDHTVRGRLPRGLRRNRLCRGAECDDRISLGGWSYTIDCPRWRAISCADNSGDGRERGPCGICGQGGDLDHPNRLPPWRRSGEAWHRREPQPAGRQPHGRCLLTSELEPKRLELVRELVPHAATIVCW